MSKISQVLQSWTLNILFARMKPLQVVVILFRLALASCTCHLDIPANLDVLSPPPEVPLRVQLTSLVMIIEEINDIAGYFSVHQGYCMRYTSGTWFHEIAILQYIHQMERQSLL